LLEAKGQIQAGELLGVRWQVVRAADLMREAFARLIERPAFNYP
jgi:hypothetical protein